MNLLTYIIIEDNRLDELSFQSILSRHMDLRHIGSFNTLNKAKTFLKNNKPDIIFSDIDMPDGHGIDFARLFPERSPILIFITSYPEYALEGFETTALDYLLKPVSEERFAITYRNLLDYYELNRLAKLQMEQSEPEHIVLKDGFAKIRIPIITVKYVQAMQDYTKVVTDSRYYLVNSTLSFFLTEHNDFNFIRIHRSYAVLMRQIKVLKSDKIMGQDFELPIGKTYRSTIAKLKL